MRISCSKILDLVGVLDVQPLFRATGATHVGLVYDVLLDEVVASCEDYSRHAMVYKLIWMTFRGSRLSRRPVFVLSCRIYSDMLSAMASAGALCVITPSAVTLDAIEVAERERITLVVFVRRGERRLTVFSRGCVMIV